MKSRNLLIILSIFILAIGAMASISAYHYIGTGFSHQISDSCFSCMSNEDILDKYNDTNCTVEVSGLCTKVIDGDTIVVEGVGKVRFVGVNTPERGVDGYKVSKNFVSKFCKNKVVGLDIDNSKSHDRYGRTLAVVIVDDKNLNEMLLQEGLAEIMFIPPSEFNPYEWENQ